MCDINDSAQWSISVIKKNLEQIETILIICYLQWLSMKARITLKLL